MRAAFLVAYYGLTAAGLVPAAYFIATFRPSRFHLAQLDAVLWVVLVFAVLGLGRVVPLALGNPYDPPTAVQAWNVLLVSLIVDATVWVRVLHWRRVRRRYRPPGSRSWWWL